ncbi:DUF1934 domain-containing protein [Desulfosporosinus sp. BICA1-9]|uniref:DUF1934 domain-containing protein n=1 Tax=Desulfosporosinus sp. BICA1-9 TaxID=1531958 RepID=UPI00054BB0A1|nr:DUF1934 domain-containing protein [Desulfosporosinus sp. BICA1-9]KJS46583.1 MAG: hypothetical protein VR66_24500 [Peptococcaceae bacterium BRH_c23]KJS87369.1 MAG: hypothetical protein JL57_14420 [Desulfosporosinus sp. BICA1-9]HBW36592.1 DUF1934 domain-containing protein [Desulfosporosinus sp.]
MRKKATIFIHGKQKYPEGHEDQQELSAEGIIYERNGAFYVLYKESGNNSMGLEEVTTLLTLKEGAVALNRKGAVELSQEYRKGVLNRSVYTTCYGKILLSVLPHCVEYDLTVRGGRISLEYDLFVEDKLVSHNELLLNIKEDIPE